MCGTLSSLGETNAAEKGSSKRCFALRLTLKKAAGEWVAPCSDSRASANKFPTSIYTNTIDFLISSHTPLYNNIPLVSK